MRLKQRVEVAKRSGFKRGIVCFNIIRAFCWCGVLMMPTFINFLRQNDLDIPSSLNFLTFIDIVIAGLYIIGFLKLREISYYFVLAKYISSPILYALATGIVLYTYADYFDISYTLLANGIYLLFRICMCTLLIIYFRNRRMLFWINDEDFVIDCKFYANAYENNCKTLKDISKFYGIDMKTLKNNLKQMSEKYGVCLQYTKYLITFSPYQVILLSELNRQHIVEAQNAKKDEA